MRVSRINQAMLRAFLNNNGGPSNSNKPLEDWRGFLAEQTGESGSLYDLETIWLRQQRAAGNTVGDLWRSYLPQQGYPASEDGLRAFLQGGKSLYGKILSLPGLVAYYPFNETSGNAINRAPSTFGSFNGTVTGATQGTPGLVGKAYSFDGTNDEVSFGDVPAISDATTLSGVAIVKTNNLTADHNIFGNGTGASAGFNFFADDVGSVSGRTNTFNIVIFDSGGQNCRVEGATNANLGNFIMVGFSFTANVANGLHLYINGTEDANSPVTSANVDDVGNSNNAVKAGQNASGAQDMNGLVQHVIFCTSALSSAQHLQLAQAAGLA